MGIASIIRTVFEIALVGFTVWAVFNEHVFIAIEEKILCNIRRKKIKVVNNPQRDKVLKLDF